MHVGPHRHRGNVIGHGNDQQGGDDALHGAEADLLQRHGPQRQRAHDPVVDLARDAELARQRQRNGGDSREHDRHSHESRQKDGPKVNPAGDRHRIAPAHARQDEGEDKQEQERLHSHPQQERQKLPRQHAQIAQKQPQKRLEEDPRVEPRHVPDP